MTESDRVSVMMPKPEREDNNGGIDDERNGVGDHQARTVLLKTVRYPPELPENEDTVHDQADILGGFSCPDTVSLGDARKRHNGTDDCHEEFGGWKHEDV